MTQDELQLLKEIRNALRYLVSAQPCFSYRSVPEEGGASMKEQNKWAEDAVKRVMKTGYP